MGTVLQVLQVLQTRVGSDLQFKVAARLPDACLSAFRAKPGDGPMNCRAENVISVDRLRVCDRATFRRATGTTGPPRPEGEEREQGQI